MSEVRRDNKGRKLLMERASAKTGNMNTSIRMHGAREKRCTVGSSHRLIEFRQENVMIFPCEKRLSRFKRT